MLDENELLFDGLYEKTKDCGRVQFINLLIAKERENQELKEQLEVGKEQYNDLVEEKENLQEQLSNSHQINAQQNEFIEYLNKYIKERRRLSKLHKEYSLSEERLSAQCHVLENVLLKYKEIIGGTDE